MNIIQTLLRTDVEVKARLNQLECTNSSLIDIQKEMLDEIRKLRNDISKIPQQNNVISNTSATVQSTPEKSFFIEDDFIPFIPSIDTEELTLTQKEKPKLKIKKGKDFLKISENLDKN